MRKENMVLNVELLKIVLLVTAPAILIILLLILYIMHAQPKNGKIYAVDKDYIHIYRLPNRHVHFSDIEDVMIGHSLREWIRSRGYVYG